MKKILGILVLGLFLISSPANAGSYGTGELTLSNTIVDWFIKYLKGGYGKKPMVFLTTKDGRGALYYYCPYSQCAPGNFNIEIKECEKRNNKECKVFARSRTVKWKNGINKGNKESKFNSKWSDAEIKAKLTELGFLGGTTSTTTKTEKKKETKKKVDSKIKKKKKTEETKTTGASLTEELKELNKLYEDGVLTKEEFEKAKKKLLN